MSLPVLIIASAVPIVGVAGALALRSYQRRTRSIRRADRLRRHTAHQKAWDMVLGRRRHRRLTDQRGRGEG